MKAKAGNTDMQVLLSFLQEGGYIYFYRQNDTSNVLEDLFFVHPTSLDLWHAFPYVMVMDATYKTNKYNMPLLEIVGVSPTNLTFCIAFVFMHKEKEFNYTWALNCLKSTIDKSLCPHVVVNDREFALMNACNNVFPSAKQLLCRWHISESIKTKCRNSIRKLDAWYAFTRCWASLIESQTEEAYYYNLAHLEKMVVGYKGVMDYLNNTWLNSYKHMFVSAWIDKFLNFGNHTTNRVESQHSKLKTYLDTSQADLWRCTTITHNLVDSQLTAIKASLEQSKTIVKHRYHIPPFQYLWGYVSIYALDILFNELERCKDTDLICDCQLRTSHELPCVHEQMNYMNAGYPLPLDSIHIFWRKLNISTCIAGQVDEHLSFDETVQMVTQKLNSRSRPETLREPDVQINNRGRPSMKQKAQKNKRDDRPNEEPCNNSRSNTSKIGETSARQSSYAGQRNYTESYIDQFPYIMHLYISDVQDVIGDGNSGFLVIAACLGFHQNDWSRIRADLLEELDMHHEVYNDMFGRQMRFELFNILNFFRSDIPAPTENYLFLPEMGVLIASKYNVILHSLSNVYSMTYLPLWSTPPPVNEHVNMAIGFVNGNHFVRVVLREEYPVPPIYLQWNRYKRPCAVGWITPYLDRINIYHQFINANRSYSGY